MSCVAPGCKSGYGSDCKLPPGVTKHIFPKDDASRRAWIEAVPRDDWEPSNSSILCSLHFTDDDFQMERCDTNPHRKNGELKRRRLKKGAVPSVFAVNEQERCLVPACRRITNTHAFPRYTDQRKKWVFTVRNYFQDPKWGPNEHSRICSKHFPENVICKVYRRADKLRPNAIPFLDKDDFPPNVLKEYPKIIPMPKIDPDFIQNTMQHQQHSNRQTMNNLLQTQTIIVKQEADYERTFVLDKSPLKRTLVGSVVESGNQSQPFQLQQLQQQQQQSGSVNGTTEPIILMRTKGNPNVLVQVEAQLWTPTGKLPKLPPVNQSMPNLGNSGEAKILGANNNKLSDAEIKDKTIEKLKAECAKLARRVTHFQDQANDSKTKMDKIVKNLTSLFGEDQMTLLCGGPIKRCTQWSERTLAKAFDLRLNCGDRAYKYLLEQGYPLPSIKTMQRHIRNVEIKLQHPDATFITQEDSDGEGVEMHHEEQQQQHHMVPMQHAYLQQYGNQHTIVKVAHVSGGILSATHNRAETIQMETSDDLNHHRPSPAKRLKKQDAEGPTWYAKLSKEVRQKIMFPDSTTEMMPQTTMTTVSTGNQDSDSRIYLASDLEYAMIPVTDGSGHTVVQQVTVQQHKADGDDDDDGKEYTTMEVSAGAPIHLHVVDEDNRTIQVLNVDNQGYVTNFN